MVTEVLHKDTEWIAELEKLKTQPINKASTQKHKGSQKTEMKKLMKLLKAQLRPVAKVFREEGKTKTQQPHIHEHNRGYTLVLPVSAEDIEPFILRIQFEFNLIEKGYAMKVIGETEKPIMPPEKIIEPPITEEKNTR
jgi:5-formyltetrahydrofolate cyclo-ligase